MDDRRFDLLAKTIATGHVRRRDVLKVAGVTLTLPVLGLARRTGAQSTPSPEASPVTFPLIDTPSGSALERTEAELANPLASPIVGTALPPALERADNDEHVRGWLSFCNETNRQLSLVYMYNRDYDSAPCSPADPWVVEGWYGLSSCSCRQIHRIRTDSYPTYYFYAKDDDGHEWSGDDVTVTVYSGSSRGFTACHMGVNDDPEHASPRTVGMREVDVGHETFNYTYSLTTQDDNRSC